MKNKSAKNWLGVVLGSAMAMSASVAQSATINESEMNGTFATADAFNPVSQQPWGSIGDITAPSNDVDIWSFNLFDGNDFTASIDYFGLYNEFDANPAMTLFWENAGSYYAVASTNPSAIAGTAGNSGTAGLSFTAWVTGNYFLAVSADFNHAEDAFGNNLTDASFFTSETIQGTAFNNFNGQSFTSFKYDITTTVVPVPAAAWLFGSGLLGLIGVSRRSQKA